MAEITKEEVLNYHKKGKIGIDLTKPCSSQHELSLAYTPGVAIPCLEIAKDENLAFEYTNKANLVAVVSDGTAVLGLGDIGPLASKPVMEGKAVLFKKFADVDAFDIELDVHTVEEIVATCKAIAPTFGGINLEDIKAPKCFEIERILKEELDIPVFHDDQHGTAIITTAGLMNVLDLTGKKVDEIKVIVNGAGAAGISCAKMYKTLGAEISSRLIPPNVGAIALHVATISSTVCTSSSMSKASTFANFLKSTDLPSMTGLEAKGPMSPSPSTAVPSEITATRLALLVYSKARLSSFAISRQGIATPGV